MRQGDTKDRVDVAYNSPRVQALRETILHSPFSVVPMRKVYKDIAGGSTPARSDDTQYSDEGVLFLRILNITEFGINIQDAKYVTEEVHTDLLNRSQLEADDVLMTITGRIGTAAVVTDAVLPANINQHIARLRPNKSEVIPDYLSAYLNSSIGMALTNQGVTGTTRTALDYGAIAKVPFIRPPLPIQRQLVTDLQAAHERRAQLLRDADAKLEGVDELLVEVLGLTLPPVDERGIYAVRAKQLLSNGRQDAYFYTPHLLMTEALVRRFPLVVSMISLLNSAPLNGIDARDYVDEGRTYLRVQNVRPYDVVLDDVKYVITDKVKDITLSKGDVLLTRKGTFGVATVVPDEAVNALISSEIMLLRLKNNALCSAEFLVAYLNSSIAQRLFDRHKSGGIMGHITQDVVSAFPVPIPDVEVQKRVTQEVERRRGQAQALRAEAAREWATAKTLFEQRLLEKGF